MSQPRVSQAYVERRLHPLAADLAGYNGFRALWFDHGGELVHSEPEDELELLGWTLVAVVMRPDVDCLRRHLTTFVEQPTPRMPVLKPLGLLPA